MIRQLLGMEGAFVVCGSRKTSNEILYACSEPTVGAKIYVIASFYPASSPEYPEGGAG
jgi:hypothetical protein